MGRYRWDLLRTRRLEDRFFPESGEPLPHYFFHRIGGPSDVDGEGVELPGLDEARNEALAFASDTLKDKRFSLWDSGEIRIEVTDANHVLLFTVLLKVEDASAEPSRT